MVDQRHIPVAKTLFILGFLQLCYIPAHLKKVDYIRIDDVRSCGHPVPNIFSNISISMPRRGMMLVNCAIYATKTSKVLPALVTIYRCHSRTYNDCENFMRVKLKDFCPLFEEKDQFWSDFYKSVKPKLKCPIPENVVYELKNSTIDLQKLLKVTAYVPNKSDYFWKFMTQIFSPQKEELICIEGMGKIESMRVKNK